MSLQALKTTGYKLPILLSTICFLLISCGSGGSSDSDPTKPSDTGTSTPASPVQTTFQFQFDIPSFAAAKGLPALSKDGLEPTIQVAIVDWEGRVTEIIDVISIEPFGGGYYNVTLPGGERIDCIVIAPLADRPDLKVGDLVNPDTSVFTPTTDPVNVAPVNVTSSVAYNIFLDSVDSFNNISTDELDEILDNAQASIDEGSLGASSIAELISTIRGDIKSQVTSETLFADASPTSTNASGNSNIEADQATIKAFFDDLNILNILQGEMSNADNTGQLDVFSGHAETAQLSLQASEGALDTLSAIENSINLWFDSLASPLPTEPTLITVDGDDEIFSSDPKASNLTGSVIYSDDNIEINLGGTYNASGIATSLTNLELSLDLTESNTNGALNISGILESDDAKLDIISGQITSGGEEPNSKILSDLDVDNQAFIDGLIEADLNLDVELTAKNVEPGQNMVLNGLLSATVIRSSNLFVEYDVPDNGEGEPFTSEGESYFNPSAVNFFGELRYKGETVSLDITLDSDTAQSYVPNPILLLPGLEYSDLTYNNAPLATYFWNGTDTFELNFADQSYQVKKHTLTDQPITILRDCPEEYCEFSEEFSNMPDFLANNYGDALYVYDYDYGAEGYEAYYIINLNDLQLGTSGQTVTAYLDYTFLGSPPATLDFTYSYSNDFIEITDVIYLEYVRTETIDYDIALISQSNGSSYEYHYGNPPYGNSYESFEAFLSTSSFGYQYFSLDSYGSFCLGMSSWSNCNTLPPIAELIVGAETTAPVYLSYAENADSKNNYQDLDIQATITATLDTLGETTVYYEGEQTGINTAIETLVVKNIKNAQLQSQINITALSDATLEDKVHNYVITNEQGFVISKSDIEKIETDKINIQYGLASAIVELLEFGLKVSYPNGEITEFDIY